MPEQMNADARGQETTGKALKRRGLIAGAAALVAEMVAKQTSQSALAGSTGQAMTVGGSNDATRITQLYSQTPWDNSYGIVLQVTSNFSDAAAIVGLGSGSRAGIEGTGGFVNGAGVQGTGGASGPGVYGVSSGNQVSKGVYGQHTADGYGVYGEATASGGWGVTGVSGNAYGVIGFSTSGVGVEGKCDAFLGVGVKGISGAGSPLIGSVEGANSATNGYPGVLGKGTAGPGVQGQSATGHGLIGYTAATDGHAALIGYAQAAGGVGLIGVAPGNSGHWAGVFYGDVHIAGTMSAPVAGTAALHPDGSRRLLQAVASPEGWFEDVGTGTLANGSADIKLDADFAALVHTDDYHVFLTPEGPLHLHVAQKGAAGFTVVGTPLSGAGGPKAPTQAPSGTFSWRVVAKRKEGGAGRLAKVAAPPALKPVRPITVPETPEVKPPKQP